MAALLCASAHACRAANTTIPGALTTYSTVVSAGFEWRITGDDDGDCMVLVDYRRFGDTAWRPGQPLMRVQHGLWTHGEDPGNLLAGSLFDLQPGTIYEARLTLADPDGGTAQPVVSFSTRVEPQSNPVRTFHVVPGNGGGAGTVVDPFRGLAAADAAAHPGDLFLLEPGVYAGPFTCTRDGLPGLPIVYRGRVQSRVVLDGQGDTSRVVRVLRATGRRFLHFEDLSVVNGLRTIDADSTEGVVVRRCHVQPIAPPTGPYDEQGLRAAGSRDLFVSDNVFQMSGQWATVGRTGEYGTGGYAILIEGTGHVICHNTIVEAWDAISMPVLEGAVPPWTTSNVDVYENFIDRATDDGVQADATNHNIRIFRNRLLNTGSAVSFQPCFGGPGYMLDNEIFNVRGEPWKFHQETFYGFPQETSGFLVYHNTSICSRNAWKETGIWHRARFRNNLFIGARVGATIDAGYTYEGASFDYDGYNRTSTPLIHLQGNWADLPAWYAGAGQEQHGREVTTAAFVNAPLPHHPEWNLADGYGAAYGTADIDLRLASGSAAVDGGVPLANIDDGYAGSAPDLGCHEQGVALPAYGPRASVLPPADVEPTAFGPGLVLDPAVPTPFVTSTRLAFSTRTAGPVALRVYDLRGALVRVLAQSVLPAGRHTAEWNGLDASGTPAAAGIYFARLEADGVGRTRRLVRIE